MCPCGGELIEWCLVCGDWCCDDCGAGCCVGPDDLDDDRPDDADLPPAVVTLQPLERYL